MTSGELSKIIEQLDMGDNQYMIDLSKRVCSISLSTSDQKRLIVELKGKRDEEFTDPCFEKSPFYNIYLAGLSYSPGSREAMKFAEKAEAQFKIQVRHWNQAICKWLISQILFMDGHQERAGEKIEGVLESLSSMVIEQTAYGLYKKNKTYNELFEKINAFKSQLNIKKSQTIDGNLKEPKGRASSNQSPTRLAGYLTLPNLMVYERVQAGSNGPMWSTTSSGKGCTQTSQVEINNQKYSIFSVNRGDRQISLEANRRYGWAMVNGNSMNTIQPTSIETGDAVLFYQSKDAPTYSIVVAACPDKTGSGSQYMVKRWDAANKLFLSSSNEPGHTPINMDEEHTIMGIVVAIAKSEKNS